MKRYRNEEEVDMTDRLRHLEELLAPRLVAPRTAADDQIEPGPAGPAVERRMGRMYVAGHEPHFRPVTLLQPVRSPRQAGSDPA